MREGEGVREDGRERRRRRKEGRVVDNVNTVSVVAHLTEGNCAIYI